LSLPQTERVSARVLTLPTGQAINSESVDIVCTILSTVLNNAHEVRKLLEERPPA